MENFAKKAMKKTTSQQFELLCSLMKEHPELATNKQFFGGSKNRCDLAWADITAKLNAIGPPARDAVEWRKVWADLKGRTKKKISLNHQLLTGTGGGPFLSEPLSPLEEMVDEAVNVKGAAVPPGAVYGIEEEVVTATETPLTNKPYTKIAAQKRSSDTTTELLKEQVKQQKLLIEKVSEMCKIAEKNTEALQKQADATEKIAEFAEKFFNYLSSD